MRRIVSAKIKFLSLVPRGANQLPVIYKSEDGTNVQLTSLTKAQENFDEQGELLSVVYAPEMLDSQGDIASAETIKEMMYDAAREGFDLDIRHDGKALSKDDAFVAESFVVQKGDSRFADFKNYKGESVDVTGGWATVIKIEHEALRKAYREGKWNGVSMAGTAEFSEDTNKADDFVARLAELLKTKTNPARDHGDIDMDKAELTTLLKENNTALAASIGEVIAEALKPEPPAGDKPAGDKPVADPVTKGDNPAGEKPIFKGDITDPKAVAAHQKKLSAWKAAQDVDWDNPESIEAYQKSLASGNEEVSDADAGIEKEDSDEIKALKKKLAKAQRQSNAGGSTQDQPGNSNAQPVIGGFSKEETDLLTAGQKAGDLDNKIKGYK